MPSHLLDSLVGWRVLDSQVLPENFEGTILLFSFSQSSRCEDRHQPYSPSILDNFFHSGNIQISFLSLVSWNLIMMCFAVGLFTLFLALGTLLPLFLLSFCNPHPADGGTLAFVLHVSQYFVHTFHLFIFLHCILGESLSLIFWFTNTVFNPFCYSSHLCGGPAPWPSG